MLSPQHLGQATRNEILAMRFMVHFKKTSNVTDRHRDLQCKLQAGVAYAAHFLQILLIFSSPEDYRLQFSIPQAHFVYTVWHCIGQHCSSIYACTYICLPVCGAPIVECGITCFLFAMHVFKVQASSSCLIL